MFSVIFEGFVIIKTKQPFICKNECDIAQLIYMGCYENRELQQSDRNGGLSEPND
jgi:hypothetical protein